MYNGNVQRNPQCVASYVTKNILISPRFSPAIFYHDANSILLNTPLYRSRLYAQNSVFEIAHQESVEVCSTHVCVCVCVFSSHSFWTSSSLDVPAGVTQEEGHTGFLIHLLSAVRALIFLARRIQPFLSLVDREVEFCVLTI